MKGTHDVLQVEYYTPRNIAIVPLVSLLLLLALTGCRSGENGTAGASSAGSTNLAGNYTLVSVNGKPVPCVVSHEGQDVTVKSGAFGIRADGTCTSTSVFSVAGHPDVNRVGEAAYTVSGFELTMRWKGAGMTKGTVNGDVFTMNNEGMIFVYRK